MDFMPTYAVRFRTKTIDGLGLKEKQVASDRLANMIVNFRGLSYQSAIDTVFAFVYGSEAREKLLNKFGYTSSQEMSEKYDFLTDNQIMILGNELRFQYKESNPDFLKVESKPDYQDEMNALSRALGNHPVLLYKAVEVCEKYRHESRDIVLQCVEFLMSEDIDSQKNGLRRLGHNGQYQNLLQPYAGKIGALLQAMCKYSETQELIKAAQQELNNLPSPFTQISKQVKEAQLGHPDATPDEEATPRAQFSLSDKLSEFIANKSSIVRNLPRDEEFWACLKRLRDIGIDLNDLLDNEEYLMPILEAHDNLDEAISALYDAEQALKEASKNFQMSDIESIHALCRARDNHEEAKKAYDIALDTFVSYCEAYEQAVR